MTSARIGEAISAIIVVLGLAALFIGLLYLITLISKAWKESIKRRVLQALTRRRLKNDSFRKVYGYSWDLFIAFRVYDEDDPVSDSQRRFSMQHVLNRLTAGGLEIRMFYSLQRKEVFCKIRCPLSRLQRHAALVNFKLAFDSRSLQSLCEKGREPYWEPLKIPINSDLTTLNPYDFIYAKYEFDMETSRTRADVLPAYKRWPRVNLEDETSHLLPIAAGDDALTANPLNAAEPPVEDGGEKKEITLAEEASIFRGVDRIKLIHMIICYGGEGGCGLDPYKLLKDQCILAYSPLHDIVHLRDVESEWITLMDWPWNQPVDRIKDYFGEKIGLYFTFLGMYTSWLIPASILGFAVWLSVASADNNPSAAAVPYFAGFMGLWSALFLEHWKRTQCTTAMRWGMSGFEVEENVRPQFIGEVIRSPVTGKPALFFSPRLALFRRLTSQVVTLVLVLIVIAVVAAIFAIQIALNNSGFSVAGVAMGGIIGSLLLTVQIQFLNAYFGEIAVDLTNKENHRTDTEYENSLIAKTFCFQFINSFAALFYIAFMKPFLQDIDPCLPGGCMVDLQTTLSTILLSRLAMGNIIEVGIPLLKSYWEKYRRKSIAKRREQRLSRVSSQRGVELNDLSQLQDEDVFGGDEKSLMSEVEKNFLLNEYHVMLGTFDDYAEMVIQFGYCTMFVAAFPLSTLISLVNNYVEIRVDAWKLCHLSRRPEPRSAEDIGTWYNILELMSISSIFVNSGLVAFTSNNCVDYSWPARAWIFIMMASGLFFIRYLVAYLVPDLPEEVQIQRDRQEYICSKVLDNVADDDEVLMKNNYEVPNLIVEQTDNDPM